MLLGYEESKEVHGRFFEFKYKTVVRRNSKSEHFGCFKGNEFNTFELVTSIFCRNLKSFEHIVNSWRCLYGIYNYIPLGQVRSSGSYIAPEVVELIYKRNNFKYVPQYEFLYDYIK